MKQNKENLQEVYANININFDGKELFISEDTASGCKYPISTKKELIEYVVNYVMDYVDTEHEFHVEVVHAKRSKE